MSRTACPRQRLIITLISSGIVRSTDNLYNLMIKKLSTSPALVTKRLLLYGIKKDVINSFKAGITSLFLIKQINDFLLKGEAYREELINLTSPDFIEKFIMYNEVVDFVILTRQLSVEDYKEKVLAIITAWNKIDQSNKGQFQEKYPALFNLIKEKISILEEL
ncbi:MAG: hypothetical protein KQH79_04090 [Bacteroidetes bacterium]|nr:hypothetical protein [Bacteroidota bacterium]